MINSPFCSSLVSEENKQILKIMAGKIPNRKHSDSEEEEEIFSKLPCKLVEKLMTFQKDGVRFAIRKNGRYGFYESGNIHICTLGQSVLVITKSPNFVIGSSPWYFIQDIIHLTLLHVIDFNCGMYWSMSKLQVQKQSKLYIKHLNLHQGNEVRCSGKVSSSCLASYTYV